MGDHDRTIAGHGYEKEEKKEREDCRTWKMLRLRLLAHSFTYAYAAVFSWKRYDAEGKTTAPAPGKRGKELSTCLLRNHFKRKQLRYLRRVEVII
jgi:hypothetical protein